jgi:Tol biopolymer transport system component
MMKKNIFFLLVFLLGCSHPSENVNDNEVTSYPTKQIITPVPTSTFQAVSPSISATIAPNLSDVCSKSVDDTQSDSIDYFVFSASWAGKSDIYLMNGFTGSQERITVNPDFDVHPKLNHSKKQIAFLRYKEDKGELYVRDIPNGREKLISPTDVSVFPDFFWSPNDRCILFTGQSIQTREFTDAYLITIDGMVQNLTLDETSALGFYASSWSSNGKSVLFSGHLDTSLTIWHTFISDLKSEKIADLTKNQFGDWSPTWNPRKDLIAFIGFSDFINTGSIFLLEPINFTQKEIKVSKGNPSILKWAPNGEKLFYVTTSEQEDITTYDVWVWDLITQETRMIVSLNDDIIGINPVEANQVIVYIYSAEKENVSAYLVDTESGDNMLIAEDIDY